MNKDSIGKLIGIVSALAVAACSAAENAASQAAAAADRGVIETRNFDLADFTGVGVGGLDKVEIRKGAAFSVIAKGYTADLDDLDIRVERDSLSVARKKKNGGWSAMRKAVTVTVTMPELSSVAVGGSGSINAEAVEGDEASASVGGSGSISIGSLAAKTVNFSIGGSGNIDAGGGKADTASINIGGSGSIKAPNLELKDAAISIAGSGSVTAQATGNATISMMGSGDVTLTGGAKCTTNRMGSGSVNCS